MHSQQRINYRVRASSHSTCTYRMKSRTRMMAREVRKIGTVYGLLPGHIFTLHKGSECRLRENLPADRDAVRRPLEVVGVCKSVQIDYRAVAGVGRLQRDSAPRTRSQEARIQRETVATRHRTRSGEKVKLDIGRRLGAVTPPE